MKKRLFLLVVFLVPVSALLLQPSSAMTVEPLFDVSASYAVGDNPQAIIMGDFNEDGHVDLAVTDTASNNVSILLGVGDGTFAAAVFYATGSGPISVITEDFDEDGHADLAVTNDGSDNISILIGAGDGTFAAAVNYDANNTPSGLVTGDFDENMHADLAVTNYFSDSISVLLGMGDGTFKGAVKYHTGSFPRSVATVDVNQDGHTDLVTANTGSDDISIFHGVGDGTFAPAPNSAAGYSPTSIATGDFDGDGDTDLAVTNFSDMGISILRGYNGHFLPPVLIYGAFDVPISITAGDLDADGHIDLVVMNIGNDRLTVLNGRGDSTFDLAYGYYDVGDDPSSAAMGDFDEDGDMDLAVANMGSDNVSIPLSYLNCHVIAVSDIPNDQGRQVTITWDKCFHDHIATHITVAEYAVYRRIDYDLSSAGGPLYYPSGDWHYLTSVPARNEEEYSVVVPTLADSTISEGMYYSTFFVSALSSEPGLYYDSIPDSGYSVDNLEPGAPAGFAVAYNAGSGNELSWDECGDEDFRYFNIYRDENGGFEPGAGTLVHSTADIHWLDTVEDGWKYHYKITSLDFSGNESDYSSPDEITGTDIPGLPTTFTLHQNYPNPFNPLTTIRFDLPASTEVTLTVYNAGGQKVRVLVDGRMTAGHKSIDWNGRVEDGRAATSGVYFYRISAGEFRETRKMILLR